MLREQRLLVGLVLVHAVLVGLHAWAHSQLAVGAPLWQNAYIGVVIIASPLAAAALLVSGQTRSGLWLLAVAMFGAFLFGDTFHFFVHGSDHVNAQPPTLWGGIFLVTAVGLALVEGGTALLAWRALRHT